MMATTHVLVGIALAGLATVVAPEFATAAVIAGALGGAFPDLDLYAGHRKTLHYPGYYALFSLVAVGAAVLAAAAITVGIAIFLLAAAAHSAMDVLGGGLELKPWHATSDRAVYDHVRGRWIAPRRWIPYDGAPEDLLLAAVIAVPALAAHGDPIRRVILAILALSAGYAIVRKPLVRVAERLLPRVPASIFPYLPDRFVDGVPER